MIVTNVDIFADMIFPLFNPAVVPITVLDFVILCPTIVFRVSIVVVSWITFVLVATSSDGEGDKN